MDSFMKKIASLTIIGVLMSVLVFSGWTCTRQIGVKPIKLTVWNLWDSSISWSSMIGYYQSYVSADGERTPIAITYVQMPSVSIKEYEEMFNAALRQGTGPDILMINNSWLPRYRNKIVPLNKGAATAQSYRAKFVDVVSYDFLEGNAIYAVPLSIDTLALYYNIELLNAAGIYDPPRTWDEFSEAVKKLTVRDEKGNIKRAGAAIGTDKNVDRSSDILSLLMMQSGSTIVTDAQRVANFADPIPDSTGGVKKSIGGEALQFYTNYANSDKVVYTWNPLMKYSIDAFTKGEVAMMISYSYNIPVVKEKNPNLKFAVSTMPQITGVTVPVNYANYWAMVVSAGSTHPTEAWDFLMYITRPDINKVYLSSAVKPTALRDLVAWQQGGEDLDMAVFAGQSPTAQSWYQHDNFATDTIFNDAINSVVLGRSTPEDASELAASQLNQIMKK
jgi:multiple sugar transport system substrate-binding protein